VILRFYRKGVLSEYKKQELLKKVQSEISETIKNIETEFCYNILTTEKLTNIELEILIWLLAETFEKKPFPEKFSLSGQWNDF